MASGWHFQEDATPNPGEVEAMVAVWVLMMSLLVETMTVSSRLPTSSVALIDAGLPGWRRQSLSRTAGLSPNPFCVSQ